MNQKLLFLAALSGSLLGSGLSACSQLSKVPDAVRQAFDRQYPLARKVEFTNEMVQTVVNFRQNDTSYTVRYTNSGDWQVSFRHLALGSFPEPVKDGFSKSKYADWKVDGSYEVLQPDLPRQFKISVEKNSLQKKNLIFSQGGRLLHDNLAL